MEKAGSNSLVRHDFKEQLNLSHIIHHHYHLFISHYRHIALGDFGNLNYYICTWFIFDEDVTKLNFNDFLNIFIVRTNYSSIYLFLYWCIVKTWVLVLSLTNLCLILFNPVYNYAVPKIFACYHAVALHLPNVYSICTCAYTVYTHKCISKS